ncbi:bifunctional GNAT family N-acetyltransferase/acetate--CoA ligase family protein [Actinocatenispora sera]|uniref:GNAT family N-acetyltransferase n=1 Tax=Actinocatenispora sera TaxID=390989 RepID=A0A810L0G2_9ACTN|nr:bifunctional GNAT family N-acetyltransferase/acetate--CoA ligase family protein [Actinocatenispora sera]BCJ28687.1 GNAT family N-acetyltransferase [Actinocatenispora sera]
MTEAAVDVLDATGHVVRLRRCHPGDADQIRTLLSALSPRSRYLRFFSSGTSIVEPELARLTRPPGPDHAAVVAQLGADIVGIGSYERLGGADSAELAVLVAERWHGRGIGTLLVEQLAAIARRHAISTLTGDVLAVNTSMLAVSEGLSARRTPAVAGVVGIRIATLPGEGALAALDARDRSAEHRSLRPALAPRSVAVVGAGRAPGGVGHEVLVSILEGDFPGPVYPVNPHADRVCGLTCYASLEQLPEPPELAVIAVPVPACAAVLRDAARRGVRAVVVLAEDPDGDGRAQRQQELVRIARDASMRMIGPNCIGVLNTDPTVRLDATFAPHRPTPGGLAVASQSGAVGVAVLDGATRAGVGISTFVSLGNKADVSGNDLLAYWYDDDSTRAVALYLESFGNPGRFARLARQLGRRKPVLAVKSGRSSSGRRAGASHSAAAATPDAIVDALFAQAGVVRTADPDELLDAARMLIDQPLPAGDQVGVIGNAGGLNILAADAAEAAGLAVPQLPGSLVSRLTGRGQRNPVDLGAGCTPDTMADAVSRLATSGAVDALVITVIAIRTADTSALLHAVGHGLATVPAVPAAVVVVGVQDPPSQLGARRNPVYPSVERAVRALGHSARYARWRRTAPGSPVTPPGLRPDLARARVQQHLGTAGPGWVPAQTAISVLADYGVSVPGHVVPASEATRAAGQIGYPVAVKPATGELVHKSEAGVVRLGLSTDAAVRAAAAEIAAVTEQPAADLLVQPMVSPDVELLAGIRHDPLFGPVVLLGAGGTLTELVDDRIVHLLPLTDLDAASMWRALRIAPALTGQRGQSPVDTTAIEQLLLRLARLAADVPEIAELDLNPVIAGPDGLTAVDVHLRLAHPAEAPDPYNRTLRPIR